jgi:hypothetical protein
MPPAFQVPRMRSLARHAAPHLLEATIIPLALFYAALGLFGIWGALVCALAWSYGAVARRAIRGHRVPGILVLGTVGLTVRTALALASGSTFVYFVQPTLGTVAVAMTFLLSARGQRPLTDRLAADFYPIPADLLDSLRQRRFFHRISILWGIVHLLNAAITMTLLLTQPIPVYLAAKTFVSLALTGSAVGLSVWMFRRAMGRASSPAFELAPVALAA